MEIDIEKIGIEIEKIGNAYLIREQGSMYYSMYNLNKKYVAFDFENLVIELQKIFKETKEG